MPEVSSQEFINKLNEVQELMLKEDYKKAILILDKLKAIEKENDYNYNLTHKLYQLDSNIHSLFNQQLILKFIFNLSNKKKEISFNELLNLLKQEESIEMDIGTLKREIEILMLRSLLSCKIEENKIIL
ncbi:MAG: hypothetical protein EU539_13595 [Promethearchaeota archaeon]|nr:MAG: hypothetical protein EU539_13595 [Candidatus Lokiarchaeota archaeon]